MNPNDILEELVHIRPDFRAYWTGENYFHDESGSFTACGVFAQFSHFFIEQQNSMSIADYKAVAGLVARCEINDVLCEAAYTCFLENIAGEGVAGRLAPYLSDSAIVFLNFYNPKK